MCRYGIRCCAKLHSPRGDRRNDQIHDRLEQRALARAVGTDDPDEGARRNVELNVPDDGLAMVRDGQIIDR